MDRLQVDSTSASGAMLGRASAPILLGFVLASAPGTSSGASPGVPIVNPLSAAAVHTTAGAVAAPREGAGASIAELRRLSGLTWEQLGRLFDVSRRAVHFWGSGKAMTPANEEHLNRIVSTLRKIDRGSVAANRAALLQAQADGTIAFDLLVRREYDRVVALLGPGAPSAPRPVKRVADTVRLARSPRPPADLVGALHDKAHQDIGITRKAKSVKVRGGH